MQPKGKQKPKKQKGRGSAKLRSALMVLLGAAIISTTVLLVMYVFRISSVEVNGEISVGAEQIVQMLNLEEGDTLMAVNEADVKDKLLSNPYLELEKMERKWPSRLVLFLNERKPAAAVAYGGSYVLIDKRGTVLETVDNVDDMLVVVNVSASAAMVGNAIQGMDEYQVSVIGRVSEAMGGSDMWQHFATIDVNYPTAIVLGTKQGIDIRLGMPEKFEQKIALIEDILPKLIGEGKNFGTLDVSNPENGGSYIPE